MIRKTYKTVLEHLSYSVLAKVCYTVRLATLAREQNINFGMAIY